MELSHIYKPIEKELRGVEKLLRDSLNSAGNKAISRICNYLLDAKGKRLRPALVLLSGKAVGSSTALDPAIIKVAAGIELIHAASLVHDDVIDHSKLRHNKPTINSKWGQDLSIALGDYLYSVAYELISQCNNIDILQCISSATKAMCEGELVQVSERDNLDLLKRRYIVIVKKKTASLFAASCQSGSLVSRSKRSLQVAMKAYGLNFGIGFQITDDYLDIVSEEKRLGKKPGQDMSVGEMTLPLLNLLKSVPANEKERLKTLVSKGSLNAVRTRLVRSGAAEKTRQEVFSYMGLAKKNLSALPETVFKKSLVNLTDFIIEKNFNLKEEGV